MNLDRPIRFEVPGTPMGRTNPFAVQNADGSLRLVQSQVTRTYEALVAMGAHQAFVGVPQISNACAVDILALLPRTKEMIDDLRYPDGVILIRDKVKKPDRDNIEKAIQDGLKGKWTDDYLVSVGTTVKGYCERYGSARTIVVVRPIELGTFDFLGYPIAVVDMPPKASRKGRKAKVVEVPKSDDFGCF